MKRKKKKKPRKTESGFAKNMKLLKRRFPHVWKRVQDMSDSGQSDQGDNDQPTTAERIQRSRLLFYGTDDPIESVKSIVDEWDFEPYDTLLLIGIGLGYFPLEAVKQGIGRPRMIILEPSVQVFHDALQCNDFAPLLKDERVDLVVGDNIPVADIIERFKEIIPLGKSPIIVHPKYAAIFGEPVHRLQRELLERVQEVKDAWFTIREHGQQMFKNTIANLPSLFAGTPMRQLRGRFKGIPAICVSAGPSLDDALVALKEINDRALIIACDSAVNALVNGGIRPHVVVTLDIFKTNIDKLKPYFDHLRDTVLIFGLESNPDNVRLFLGPRRVAVSAYSKLMSFWLDPQMKLESLFPEMSSVSHLALFSALAMGADPIVMVGMDLAFANGKSHSFGSAFFHSLEDKKTIFVHGNDGSMLPSTHSFVADRLLIENITGKESARFINTSVGGAFVPATTIKCLEEVRDVDAAAELNVARMLDSIDWTCAADEARAASELGVFIRLLEGVRNKCRLHIKALSDVLHPGNPSRGQTADLNYCTKAEKEYKAFEEQHFAYKSMIKEIMLADLEKNARQREVVLAGDKQAQNDAVKKRLEIVHSAYGSFERGLDLQIREIERLISYLTETSQLKKQSTSSDFDCNTGLELARHFNRSRELWQAVGACVACSDREPDDATPHLELMQILIDANLWLPAHSAFMRAKSMVGSLPEIENNRKNIDEGIDALFEAMKNEWMQGNMHSTRKLLFEYMTLRPDDPQAIELKSVITELDREFAAEWVDNQPATATPPDMAERFKKVVAYVKKNQPEKGIGILEGMACDFGEQRAMIREQLGDIRSMQKDYPSAVWNYRQALKSDPMKLELQSKIDRLSSKLGGG
jgi:hypothetical protein